MKTRSATFLMHGATILASRERRDRSSLPSVRIVDSDGLIPVSKVANDALREDIKRSA